MMVTPQTMLAEDFDPITAFTNVTAARDRYIKAQKSREAAQVEEGSALMALNEAQQKYDQVTDFLKKHAPPESWWGP